MAVGTKPATGRLFILNAILGCALFGVTVRGHSPLLWVLDANVQAMCLVRRMSCKLLRTLLCVKLIACGSL